MQYPEVKITRNQLCRIYNKNGVKRKVIRNTKILSVKKAESLQASAFDLKEKMTAAIKSKRCIIYVDEIMFTSSSVLKREYSTKGTNIMVDYN